MYICFLPGWSGAEIKFTVNVALPKRPINYRGSPTSTVSTSMISTSMNFSAIGIKLVLVEFLCSKIRTSGNWLCSTY
jgi:hypothetical protein